MEQNKQIPQDPTQPTVTTQPVPTPRKLTPKESIQLRISEVKHAIGLDNPQKKRKILIAAIGFPLVILIFLVGYSLLPKKVATPLATLTPTPVGTEAPRGEPSEYADDPEILKILNDLQSFDQRAKSTTIRNDNLRLPSVDWNISF